MRFPKLHVATCAPYKNSKSSKQNQQKNKSTPQTMHPKCNKLHRKNHASQRKKAYDDDHLVASNKFKRQLESHALARTFQRLTRGCTRERREAVPFHQIRDAPRRCSRAMRANTFSSAAQSARSY